MTQFDQTPACMPLSAVQGKLSAARVVRTAIGDMFSRPEANGLSAVAAGALVTLVRHAAGEPSGVTPMRQATAALAMKGLSASDAELVLSALQMTGFVRLRENAVTVPLLDEAVRAEATALRNRMTGWVKRGARVGATTQGAAARATPAIVGETGSVKPTVRAATVGAEDAGDPASSAMSTPSPAAGCNSCPPDQTATGSPEPRPGAARSRRRIEAGVEYCRFTSSDKKLTDPEDDAVVARIPCKSDSVAEITADYMADLQATFRGVDVEQELRNCRMWCQSNPKLRKTFTGLRRFLNTWMTTAARDSLIRASVVRGAQPNNGFGQGGGYGASVKPDQSEPRDSTPPTAGAEPVDDFADLAAAPLSGRAPDASAQPLRLGSGADAARPMSKAVLAARARLQHGAAGAVR